MIDSLGIKIDYITGTSMGGILGGLYAMGYNADQLKETVYKVHWHRILSNKIPYNKINISEKDEYDKYILEFPVVKGFPYSSKLIYRRSVYGRSSKHTYL